MIRPADPNYRLDLEEVAESIQHRNRQHWPVYFQEIVPAMYAEIQRLQAAEASKWITPAPALSQPSNLPKQDEKVLLELASVNYAVGQLTWAYRWLLQGGAVLLLQDVVRWQPIVGATVKGGQPSV